MAVNDHEIQAVQLPAVNGIGSARRAGQVFGAVDGVRLLSAAAMENARREQVRGPDLAGAAMTESALGLGFNLPTPDGPLGAAGSFGTVGLGGCRAWALPESRLAFAYLPTTSPATSRSLGVSAHAHISSGARSSQRAGSTMMA